MRLENFKILMQLSLDLGRLPDDMKANAKGYKAMVTAGEDSRRVKTLMRENNQEYKKRLDRIKRFYGNQSKRDKLKMALDQLGIPISTIVDSFNKLTGLIDATDKASLRNPAEINEDADNVINNIDDDDLFEA